MAGFGDLLAVLGAIDAKGKSVIKTMDRVADRTLEAEPVTDALTLRRANAATPVAAETPALVRILGQMKAVIQSATEAQEVVTALNESAGEITEGVKLKISKQLAAILDPGNGEGISGNFDKTTGQFLGGAFSNERARDLVDRFGELLDLQATKLDAFQQFYVQESLKLTAQQFRVEFGSKLGDIKSLLKQLREYQAATAKKDANTGPTSGTLGKSKATASASTSSIAVLRLTGGLR